MGISRTMTRHRHGGLVGGLVRGLSGVLVGGLVALALVLLGGWFYADRAGLPGPGLAMIVGHGMAAVLAVVAQVRVDRHPDRRATLAAVALAGLVAGGLALTWLF